MTMYSVSTSYQHTTISVGVEAENEQEAEQEALDVMAEEWGVGVRDYDDLTIQENN